MTLTREQLSQSVGKTIELYNKEGLAWTLRLQEVKLDEDRASDASYLGTAKVDVLEDGKYDGTLTGFLFWNVWKSVIIR